MTRHRSETYEHTISGLLGKRQELMQEIAGIRERMAVATNDIDAIDRILVALGYKGDIVTTAKVPRISLFYRGEMGQFVLSHLREHGPSSTRQLAVALAQIDGKDAIDRRMLADVVRRIGKALRVVERDGAVTRTAEKLKGEYIWSIS